MTLEKIEWLTLCGLLLLEDTSYHQILFRIIFLQIEYECGMIHISLDRTALLLLSNMVSKEGTRCDTS